MKNIVLITRPEDSAAETAYAINQKGYLTFCEPFLDVCFHETNLPDFDDTKALIFTSANAVQALILKSDRRDFPVYCVGDQTLTAVRQAGFKTYKSAQGTVSDLIDMLQQEAVDGKMLYVRARDIARPLVVQNQEIDEIVVYHTEKTKEISKNCLDLMQEGAFSHILFYSSRTAQCFSELVEKQGVQGCLNQCQALCLGDSMVECIANLQWKHIAVAKTPDRQGMLELLETSDG